MVSEKIWWYVARSSGIVAWALLAVSVLWGLFLATRWFQSRPKAPWLLDVHRWVSGLAVTFTGLHLLGLWLDSYVEFGIVEMLVPMASEWQPGAVAWGVVGLYGLAAVQVTSLLKSRLSHRAWRRVHHAALATYALATVHFAAAGTDAGAPPAVLAMLAVSGAILALGLVRVWAPRGRLPRQRRSAAPSNA